MALSFFTLSFAGSTLFVIALVIAHLVRSDLAFGKNSLSTYAVGPMGWITTLGLYSIGLAQILLAVGLLGISTFSYGHAFLIIAGTGTLLVAACKLEFPKRTLRGYLHDIGAGVQFSFFPISLLSLSQLFVGGALYTPTVFVGSVSLCFLGAISYIHLRGKSREVKYFGLLQKTNIILMSAWVVLVSFALM